MASIHTSISPRALLYISKTKNPAPKPPSGPSLPVQKPVVLRSRQRTREAWAVRSVLQEELDVIPIQSRDPTDQQEGVVVSQVEREGNELANQLGGFGSSTEGRLSFEGFPASSSASVVEDGEERKRRNEEFEKLIDRTINATIVLAAGTFAITKLLTIDHDYWHGWTIYEILRYAPQHNWLAYEETLKTNPVLAKMVISGVVYSLGDWIAQCYEGKPLFEFDRARMLRSGLVGFALHGSLSHYYYQFCEELIPTQSLWSILAKVSIDQTFWASVWNSIYYVVLGLLRFESPTRIFKELKGTFWPMLTAGWKLWPFAHLITYGFIPLQQRLLWVDCVELIWVTILSTYSNEKSEARISEASAEAATSSSSTDSSQQE